ncbi:hypothetical protein NM208_g6644 [Fusarium decemcellulare]|uniref:Uncharacterized protein n=1 Tax=Fusarium decemcellulare TaxID=57161 RepID=A0ACC1SCC0_9HYPO|nr:hypothetical protein NM208_g6644 [Fusarium decemcellulare]
MEKRQKLREGGSLHRSFHSCPQLSRSFSLTVNWMDAFPVPASPHDWLQKPQGPRVMPMHHKTTISKLSSLPSAWPEVVGTVSASVSLVATALHATRVLANDLSSIKDAPQTITNLKAELQNVQSVIQSLQTALSTQDSLQAFRDIAQTANVDVALKACRDSCGRFHKELKDLLKHSNQEKLSKRDRFSIGFLAKDRVVALTSELNVCKSTVGLALNGANLLVSMEHYKQLQVMATPPSSGTSTDAAAPEQSHDNLATDIERGVELSKGYQDLLALLQSKVNEHRTQIEVGSVVMLNSARVMAGVNNVDGTEGEMSVKIGNVKADGGKALLGYTNKVDVDAFLDDLQV